MSDVSNKSLVLFLVIAIVISLAGTVITLNKLGSFKTLTGLQTQNVTTQYGTTSVTLLSTYQLTIYNGSIQWGSGQINGSYTTGLDYCNLTTNASFISAGNDFTAEGFGSGGKTAPCSGFAATTPWSMVIENTGTDKFTNVTLTAASGDAGIKSTLSSNAKFQFRVAEEDGSATSLSCGGATGQTTTYANVPTAVTNICSNFNNTAVNDAFLVQFKMDIPEDTTAATFSDNLTFNGVI